MADTHAHTHTKRNSCRDTKTSYICLGEFITHSPDPTLPGHAHAPNRGPIRWHNLPPRFGNYSHFMALIMRSPVAHVAGSQLLLLLLLLTLINAHLMKLQTCSYIINCLHKLNKCRANYNPLANRLPRPRIPQLTLNLQILFNY